MSESIPEVHKGSCFCGVASYTVTGKPTLSAYCHCTLCQRLNSSPFINTIHFPASSFSWTSSEVMNKLDTYSVQGKPWKTRYRCKSCGCTVSSFNSRTDNQSIWGSQLERGEDGKILDWDELKPTDHIFYGTRMLDVEDGLPKWEGYAGKSKRIG